MTLKVIGAGLGRTGTLSLKFALEHLGVGPCHHMAEVWANATSQIPQWLGVIAGKPDWEAVFEGYASAVDYPVCTWWRELADLYPEAKIILSVRSPESWFESVSTTVFSPSLLANLAQGPIKTFLDGVIFNEFGDKVADRAFMVNYFRKRTESIIAEVPPERLLVFEAKQGWEPLCAFLGVPVPAIPFPRVNSREEMLERIAQQSGDQTANPPTPEEMMALAKENLNRQRKAIFAGA